MQNEMLMKEGKYSYTLSIYFRCHTSSILKSNNVRKITKYNKECRYRTFQINWIALLWKFDWTFEISSTVAVGWMKFIPSSINPLASVSLSLLFIVSTSIDCLQLKSVECIRFLLIWVLDHSYLQLSHFRWL